MTVFLHARVSADNYLRPEPNMFFKRDRKVRSQMPVKDALIWPIKILPKSLDLIRKSLEVMVVINFRDKHAVKCCRQRRIEF